LYAVSNNTCKVIIKKKKTEKDKNVDKDAQGLSLCVLAGLEQLLEAHNSLKCCKKIM